MILLTLGYRHERYIHNYAVGQRLERRSED
jgi:hypothetical protein